MKKICTISYELENGGILIGYDKMGISTKYFIKMPHSQGVYPFNKGQMKEIHGVLPTDEQLNELTQIVKL